MPRTASAGEDDANHGRQTGPIFIGLQNSHGGGPGQRAILGKSGDGRNRRRDAAPLVLKNAQMPDREAYLNVLRVRGVSPPRGQAEGLVAGLPCKSHSIPQNPTLSLQICEKMLMIQCR